MVKRGRSPGRTLRAGLAPVAAALLVVAATRAGFASSQGGRPFDHRRHERVISCRTCHGAGATHRTFLVRTARDCAACHHDERSARSCGDCHSAADLSPRRSVRVSMSLTVWDSARSRVLPFGHDVHTSAGLGCRECHREPVTLAVNRQCGSCHEPHHRAEATCATCHADVPPQAHKAAAHLSCAGSGCHAQAVAPPPTLSRTLCLACHTTKQDHEPKGACAACHGIPDQKRVGREWRDDMAQESDR